MYGDFADRATAQTAAASVSCLPSKIGVILNSACHFYQISLGNMVELN